MSKHE